MLILPDLHWNTMLGLPSWAWAAIVAPVTVFLMAKSGKQPALRKDGICWLRPSIGMYLLLPIAFVMLILFGLAFIVSLVAIFREPTNALVWLLIVMSPFLVFISGGTIWDGFLLRTGFCEAGLIRQRFGRRTILPWDDMDKIKRHAFLGPLVHLKNGRRIAVLEYFRGFQDLIDSAKTKGVTIEIAP